MGSPLGDGAGAAGYDGTQQGGVNPAWQEFLEVVPQEYHEKITPVLDRWDKGVNERFETVQSEYAPWKPIISNGYDPETTQFALNLLSALNEDPKMVYEAIGKQYPQVIAQAQQALNGQGQGEPSTQEEDPYAARIAQLENQNKTIAEAFLAKQREEQNKAEDARLAQEMDALRKTHGDYDESWVLSKMHFNKMSAKDAVLAYKEWEQSKIAPYMPKPLFASGGGALPSQNVDPRKLDDKSTKSYVVGLLQAAQAEKNR